MSTTHHAAGPTVPPPEPHPQDEDFQKALQHLGKYQKLWDALPEPNVVADNAAPQPKDPPYVFNRLVLKAIAAAMVIAFGAGYWVGYSTKKVQFIERLHANPEQVVLL